MPIIGRIEKTCLLLVLLALVSTTSFLQFHAEAVKHSAGIKKGTTVHVSLRNRIPGIDYCQSGVDVENGPVASTFDYRLNRTFVANEYSNTVSVIGLNDRTVATIDVGTAPVDLTYYGGTNSVYVVNSGSNNISEIDPIRNRVVRAIAVGLDPVAVFVDEDHRIMYVANYGSNSVTLLDPDSLAKLNTIHGFSGPTDVVVLPGGEVYVANLAKPSISVLNFFPPSSLIAEPKLNLTLPPVSLPPVAFHLFTELAVYNDRQRYLYIGFF